MSGPPGVAVVVATRNGASYLSELLESISAQTQQPDRCIFVDDASTDGTVPIINEWASQQSFQVTIEPAQTSAKDLRTRIASNFAVGMTLAMDHEFIALSDQDDIWRSDRIAHQTELLMQDSSCLLVASNSQFMNEAGWLADETIASEFDWPDWTKLDPTMRWRTTFRRPLVQGGASMLRSELLQSALPIPVTWLHDRWLSLTAAALGGLILDRHIVMSYRIHDGQVVGPGFQHQRSRIGKLLTRGTSLQDLIQRSVSISQRLNPVLTQSGVDRTVRFSDFIEIATSRRE